VHTVVLIEPTIHQAGVALLRQQCHVVMAPNGKESTLIRAINENHAEGLLPRVEPITRKVIEECPSLKVIGEPGVGLDNIDVQAASEHGIMVLNVPDGNYTTVSEHAILFVLACAQNLIRADKNVREGNWSYRDTNLPSDVRGKTLLIVGFGRIGKSVAKKAMALEMNILAYDEYVSAEKVEEAGAKKVYTLEEGLKDADFVTIHVPLTPQTRGMFSTAQFSCMKESAYICNLGRGPVVDEPALYQALSDKKIAGAALDVLDPEPPLKDNPLFQLDNVIFTPHTGGDTKEARERLATKAAAAMIAALNGEKPMLNWANRKAMEG
jgi:D-3-phosphoglycerate dehydrogenase